MSAISDLYDRINDIDEKLIGKWASAVRKEIERFGKSIQPASPFIDKPNLKDDKRRGRFWLRQDLRKGTVTMYGIAPNIGRVKGFGAPVNRWHETKPYRFKYGRRWVTFHRAQDTSTSPGIETKQPYFGGTPVRPSGYFGIGSGKRKLWGYGRTDEGATPIYYEYSYADWLMEKHDDDLENLILECGRDVLADYLAKGGTR